MSGPGRHAYTVSVTAEGVARVAVDLTSDEADLLQRIADALYNTGDDYSGILSIRTGRTGDPDCSSCAGSGRLLYDGPLYPGGIRCGCMPTATVDRVDLDGSSKANGRQVRP
ncbi:hypothetical protein [Frankia sp. Cj3]|uniref:hypothetical protein n=1 Tax=Frankia sp. Cj3 TaxID=2880976 RepID=UPI001EF3F5BB|nr:hypothetical protein [Frankia sp. Cj3]